MGEVNLEYYRGLPGCVAVGVNESGTMFAALFTRHDRKYPYQIEAFYLNPHESFAGVEWITAKQARPMLKSGNPALHLNPDL